MSKTNDQVKIVLKDEQGKEWVSNETYGSILKRIEFLEERRNWFTDEILKLHKRVRTLEKPMRAEAILELVAKESIPRRSVFFSHRLGYDNWDWQTWNELVTQGRIVKVKRGKLTLYRIGGVEK